MNNLAIHGGPKTKTTPFGSGNRFGEAELKELKEALEQGTLFYHYGEKVKQFLHKFNEMYDVKYSVATSSGTAAIHVALGAAGVTAGDEVITSPITDQGTVIGILYQNAIPVFADVLPHTYNLDPASLEACITERTKAIVVVHLAGNPCDMDAIMAIARKHELKVIEDCAQSYMCYYKGKLTGTIGDYGCFSTNDFKHISTGDGGMVTVNSGREDDYAVTHAFADKNYQRFDHVVSRDIHHIAPNYRMTELQGAVGIAQLDKLTWICDMRGKYGTMLIEGLSGIAGVYPPKITEGGTSSFWFFLFRLDTERLIGSVDDFVAALNAEGISCVRGYIPQPVYLQPLFQTKEAYPGTHYPFTLSEVSYEKGICPHAEEVLQTSVRIGISEFYTPGDIEEIIEAITKVAAHMIKGGLS
ncbi:DegT/DnrJ/EryC1/StrS family aminotransferase [Paenibacillus sp. HN-1]|uniref:DegT/DnrJ/EryC1/StrS family aminotransferase n=1 Tax=Paenibacillus TaxID=44249 RepID=UPI001CA8D2D4|nr:MULTISPECIES: DegT/DnrJ/EryC1/StrS family aminotransferase [Paenibacillus]MBY9078202.1 DegT/DnrJ/EryC1/StrS family aminotransferase [Paenibacillus sp. CGMCC 1.18879]MBY9086139.1 DegT/DnrJ/EryC1/StrS family aminotransferase [Paenibacillus sinensis]